MKNILIEKKITIDDGYRGPERKIVGSELLDVDVPQSFIDWVQSEETVNWNVHDEVFESLPVGNIGIAAVKIDGQWYKANYVGCGAYLEKFSKTDGRLYDDPDKEDLIEDEDGPYGGGFESWEDYYSWKER